MCIIVYCLPIAELMTTGLFYRSCDLEGSFLTSTNDRDPLSKEDIEVEIGLSPDQNSMMMSEDITQCLHSSADCWEKMSQTFKNEVRLHFLTCIE